MAAPDKPETRSHRPLIHPITNNPCPVPEKGWRFTDKKMDELIAANRVEFGVDEATQPRQKYFLKENMEEAVSSLLYYGGNDDAMGLPFDNPKPVYVAKKLISTLCKDDKDIVLDFFSGSATTAHALMQLNAESSKKCRFILVQVPETIPEKTTAYKSGYKTITDIGKERIRRSGKMIKDEYSSTSIDVGFRVFKCDSSNMRDIFYSPDGVVRNTLEDYVDVIKDDRESEDLLIQVMLELGIELSSKIEQKSMHGHTVYSVDDGYLVACFDDSIDDSTIVDISKEKSGCMYAVFRSGSSMTDEMLANIEQIFKTYSPQTKIRIL